MRISSQKIEGRLVRSAGLVTHRSKDGSRSTSMSAIRILRIYLIERNFILQEPLHNLRTWG
jgi:hypothetical protein